MLLGSGNRCRACYIVGIRTNHEDIFHVHTYSIYGVYDAGKKSNVPCHEITGAPPSARRFQICCWVGNGVNGE